MSEPRHLVAVSIDGKRPEYWTGRRAAILRLLDQYANRIDEVGIGEVTFRVRGKGTNLAITDWLGGPGAVSDGGAEGFNVELKESA